MDIVCTRCLQFVEACDYPEGARSPRLGPHCRVDGAAATVSAVRGTEKPVLREQAFR
jgi:hypothetical protein